MGDDIRDLTTQKIMGICLFFCMPDNDDWCGGLAVINNNNNLSRDWKMTLSTASPMPFNASTCNCNCQQTRNVEQSSWQYRIFKFRMYYIQFQVQVKCWLAFHSISRRVCDLAKLDANTTRRYFRVESVISILSLPHTTIALTWFTIIIDHIHRTFTILDCAIFRLNASHCRIYQCALA